MKHKHADLIIAWANGAEIEWFDGMFWLHFDNENVSWESDCAFRIKPKEEKKPVVRWLWAYNDGYITGRLFSEEEIKFLTNSTLAKLEWSRTEFPE